MRMTLPAGFNQVAPQVLILFLILSIRGSQEEVFQGGFKYGDPKVFEIGPLGGPFDAKDFADVGEVPGRVVPGINMAFVIV